MNRIHGRAWMLLVVVLGLPIGATGQSTYADPKERFTLELPQGWRCTPVLSVDSVTCTQKIGGFVTAQLFWAGEVWDLSRTFDQEVSDIKSKSSSFREVSKQREETDLRVNGKPAMWSVYRAKWAGKYWIECFGAVSLSQGNLGVSFQFPEDEAARSASEAEGIFQSIRDVVPAVMRMLQDSVATGAAGTRGAGPGASVPLPQKFVTFEDLNGRYALDVPENWKEERISEDETLFRGTGAEGILVTVVDGETDKAKMFSTALEQLKMIMPDASLQGPTVDSEVNAMPARRSAYRGTVSSAGNGLKCIGLLGSVALEQDEGGVYFISLADEVERPIWGDGLEKVFRSIRPGPPILATASRPGVAEGSQKPFPPPAAKEDGKQAQQLPVLIIPETVQRLAAREGPARWRTVLGAAQLEDMRRVSPGKLLVGLRKDDQEGANLDYLLVDTTSGRVLWRYNREKRKQALFSLMLASDEMLLFNVQDQNRRGEHGAAENTLLALDAQSGAEKWAQSYTSEGTIRLYADPLTPVAVAEKVEKRNVKLVGVNLADGKTAWEKEFPVAEPREKGKGERAGGPLAPPLLIESGDVLHFYEGAERLAGKDGGSRWRRGDLELDGECPAAQTDGRELWLVDRGAVLTALDAATGATRWKAPLPNGVRYTNIYPDAEKIYVRGAQAAQSGTPDATQYLLGAVSRQDGKVLWTQMLKEPALSNLIEANGRLYLGTASLLMALDAASGRQVFASKATTDKGNFPVRIVSYPDKVVYVGEFVVAAYDPTTGKQIYIHRVKPIANDLTMWDLEEDLNLVNYSSYQLARMRGGKHAKDAAPSSLQGTSPMAMQQLARMQDMASSYNLRAAELSRRANAAPTQGQQRSLREESKLESHQAATATAGEIAIMRMNNAFEREQAMTAFVFSMIELGRTMQEAPVEENLKNALKHYTQVSRALFIVYQLGETEDYLVRPNLKSLARGKQFVTLAVIHLPTGKRRDTYLSPSYLKYGLWNIVNFNDGVVYHDGIGMDPSLYQYSEPHTGSLPGKNETVENLLIASPVRIPQ